MKNSGVLLLRPELAPFTSLKSIYISQKYNVRNGNLNTTV